MNAQLEITREWKLVPHLLKPNALYRGHHERPGGRGVLNPLLAGLLLLLQGQLSGAMAATNPSSYLLSEGFEGVGYENSGWGPSISTTAPDPDFDAPALVGSQSLRCNGLSFIQRPFVRSEPFYCYFQVRWLAWSDYKLVVDWLDANQTSATALLTSFGNKLEAKHGAVSVAGTTVISLNTTYHIWLEWAKGTGNDGTMKLFVSTNGTKPASPEASVTTGNGGTPAFFDIGPFGAGTDAIYDLVLIDDEPIGSNPDGNAGGNTAPTISSISNQTTPRNTPLGPIPFTVGDAETNAAALIVTGSSSNPALIPNDGITFGGSGANRTITLTPAASQSGTTIISVTVSDGALTASTSFSLTVSEENPDAVLTVTVNSAVRPYGTANPVFTGTLTGLRDGDNITATYTTTATVGSSVGEYPIVAVLNDPDGRLGGYIIVTNRGMLTISPAPLQVIADDKSRDYGTANPSLTGTLTGARNGDSITASYATTATSASSAGVYAIVPTLNDPQGRLRNYTVTSRNGTLTINPALLTVIADDKTRGVGEPNPPLTGTITGLQNGDGITATYTTTAGLLSLPGHYPITPALRDPDNKLGNYKAAIHEGTLTVTLLNLTPADHRPLLEVKAHNQTRFYGSANPALTGTVTGLESSDDITVTFTTTAYAGSAAHAYAITPVLNDPSGNLWKYRLKMDSATLTVVPASLTVIVDDKTRSYGMANPALTGAVNGLRNGDNITVTYTTAATDSSPAGAYMITPELNDLGAKLSNYTLGVRNGTLTIRPAVGDVRISSITSPGNRIRITGRGDANINCTIQASSDLIEWTDIGAAATDSSGRFEFEEAHDSGVPFRFYRALRP